MYHAGASIASNFLVTLHGAAARALACADVPPDVLVPLMRRTIDNNFDLTGPIARGDTATVEYRAGRLTPKSSVQSREQARETYSKLLRAGYERF